MWNCNRKDSEKRENLNVRKIKKKEKYYPILLLITSTRVNHLYIYIYDDTLHLQACFSHNMFLFYNCLTQNKI